MTNNGVGSVGNYANVIYDSGNDTSTGKKRIGISATEVELFNDIPLSYGTGIPTSTNNVADRGYVYDTQRSSATDNQKYQNNYQTLSTHREQPNSHVVYQGGDDRQLSSAVNKLLDKYAPDATPQQPVNTTTIRQQPPQVNLVTGRNEPSFSTFQTGAPSSSTVTNNYSTIIRPNAGQIPQTQTQINNNNTNSQASNHSQPNSSYDSFQHVIPPSQQQQQQQQQPQKSIPIKTTSGNIAQVVPGKLYTLDDDPLHLLYDRQPTAPRNPQASSQQQPQQSSFQTTFQPSSNFQTIDDHLATMHTDTSQKYPQQPISITRDANSNGRHPLDLGNIIKRVQEDYLREIQPYVSSVKFIEKDREYGQNLNDIGFSTPITIRKGFTGQADDILRRSFGRDDDHGASDRRDDHGASYRRDDRVASDRRDDHDASDRRRPPDQMDSRQSFTSVSSASTNASDYDDPYSSLNNRKNKGDVRDQATSPLRKEILIEYYI
jgi:hypothetical protein